MLNTKHELEEAKKKEIVENIEKLKEFAKANTLNGLSLSELRHEGHRY